MPKLTWKSKIVNTGNIAVIVLLFDTFSWFYLCRLTISKLGCDAVTYLTSIAISFIAGVFFLRETKRLWILEAWVVFGALSSLLTVFLAEYFPEWSIVFIFLLGVSLGVAMPFCLDLLTKVSAAENRGKIGGVILFATFSTVFILYGSILSLDLVSTGIFLALWRFWSLPFVFLISEELFQENGYSQKTAPTTFGLGNRTFLLYFAAWLMFSLIDSFQTIVMNTKAEEFAFFIKGIEPCVAGFSAILVGAISDIIGRRRVLVFSFAFLGIAYGMLGLFPQSLIAWLLYSIVDGVSIGSASVLLIIVIWGEVAVGDAVNFYAMGEVPFFIAEALSLMLRPYLILVPQNSSFSLASFFLFIAVIPLLFAPETLPEKTLRERELRSYIEKAKRVREKFTKG